MTTNKKKGFTLIELLVVIGVLGILVSVVLIAVNPADKLGRARDVSARATAKDFADASISFYATQSSLPWDGDPACQAELTAGQTLDQMPNCTHDLINDGKLEANYNNSSVLKEIHMTKCGKSAVLCYNPKSKQEYEDAETKYDKFGINDPQCQSKKNGTGVCYWCKPIMNDPQCLVSPTPTPTLANTPTPTPIPTDTPTPTPTPVCLYKVGSYCLDDTKFLQTYAVLAFPYPGFPETTTQPDQDGGVDSGWMVDVSFRPDFGGTTVVDGFGYFVNGVPVTTDADTDLWAARGGDFFADWAAPSVKAQQTDLTPKHFAFLSMPFEWSKYVNGCGKTIYWRVVNFRTGIPGVNYDSNKFSPTYTGTLDCTTKVGVIGSWYDVTNNGVTDYTDYIILSLQTRLRAGGWQPPE